MSEPQTDLRILSEPWGGNTVGRVLLVEDSPDDILITRKAIKKAGIVNKLYVVRNGQEAIEFLQHRGAYQDPATSPPPSLILLDINLPKLNGFQVLAYLKHGPPLKRIPVVMLTSSKREEDVLKSYDQGCNSFIQKPVEFDRFVEVVKEIEWYWHLLNVSPRS